MVVNGVTPHEGSGRAHATRGADVAHPVDLGRLLALVDGLATTRFARVAA